MGTLRKKAKVPVQAPKRKKTDDRKTVAVSEIQPLVEAAWAALSTFNTLRRQGTSFSREAYERGYKALDVALAAVPHYCFKEGFGE